MFLHLFLTLLFTGSASIYYVRFIHPESILFLSVDREASGEHLARFSDLQVLVCNQTERVNQTVLSQFVSGQLGQLTRLRLNLAKLQVTEYQPTADQIHFFRQLYNGLTGNLEQDGFVFDQIKSGLAIYFHEVGLDLGRLQFDDYHFDQTLVQMHSHNRVTNQLNLLPCVSTSTCDYIKVLAYFEPGIDDRFQHFAELYPNVRQVSITPIHWDEREGLRPLIKPDEVRSFLASCRSCMSLNFTYTGLLPDFFSQLHTIPSCSLVNSISIFESDRDLTQRIDLNFLTNFEFLQLFETNTVTREQMLQLLTSITRQGQNLIFYFQGTTTCIRLIFVKMLENRWLAGCEMLPDQVVTRIDWSRFNREEMELDDISAFLKRSDVGWRIPHWLETLPATRQAYACEACEKLQSESTNPTGKFF